MIRKSAGFCWGLSLVVFVIFASGAAFGDSRVLIEKKTRPGSGVHQTHTISTLYSLSLAEHRPMTVMATELTIAHHQQQNHIAGGIRHITAEVTAYSPTGMSSG